MNTKILLGIAIALSAYAVINGSISYVIAQETTRNTTTTEEEQNVKAETVATGQEAVPVITANGSVVAQAAPADAVNSLLTTIFTIAVPAITGLVIAVVSMVKSFSKDKKVQTNADEIINVAKYIDTFAPKVNEQYVTSGAFKTGFNIIADALDDVKPGTKSKIAGALESVPDIEKKIQAGSLQLNKLRSQLPAPAKADNDPSIGNLDKS